MLGRPRREEQFRRTVLQRLRTIVVHIDALHVCQRQMRHRVVCHRHEFRDGYIPGCKVLAGNLTVLCILLAAEIRCCKQRVVRREEFLFFRHIVLREAGIVGFCFTIARLEEAAAAEHEGTGHGGITRELIAGEAFPSIVIGLRRRGFGGRCARTGEEIIKGVDRQRFCRRIGLIVTHAVVACLEGVEAKRQQFRLRQIAAASFSDLRHRAGTVPDAHFINEALEALREVVGEERIIFRVAEICRPRLCRGGTNHDRGFTEGEATHIAIHRALQRDDTIGRDQPAGLRSRFHTIKHQHQTRTIIGNGNVIPLVGEDNLSGSDARRSLRGGFRAIDIRAGTGVVGERAERRTFLAQTHHEVVTECSNEVGTVIETPRTVNEDDFIISLISFRLDPALNCEGGQCLRTKLCIFHRLESTFPAKVSRLLTVGSAERLRIATEDAVRGKLHQIAHAVTIGIITFVDFIGEVRLY